MAKLDKTFPTLDCSACILTPKMVSVGQHPNIELLSYSEVEDVSGYVGNFKIKIKKKSRFVNEKCTACAECIKVCPVNLPSEFEEGLSKRQRHLQTIRTVSSKYLRHRQKGNPAMQDLLSYKNGCTGLYSTHKGRKTERGICSYEKDKPPAGYMRQGLLPSM